MSKWLILLCFLYLSWAYNQQTSVLHAKFSVISHCTNAQIQSWSCALCKSYPKMIHLSVVQNTTTNIKGFVGYDSGNNNIVVSWRGTENNINWIQNADFKLADYIGPFKCVNCKIHDGFQKAYQSVSAKAHEKISQLVAQYPTARISMTGHSLGGALALITNLHIYREFTSKISEIYVYGCPRIGNANLASYLHMIVPDTFRVIHYKDIVPHLPPSQFQYVHPAYQVLYDQQMKNYIVCNESGQDPKCSDGLGPVYSPNDHTTYWFKTDSSIC